MSAAWCLKMPKAALSLLTNPHSLASGLIRTAKESGFLHHHIFSGFSNYTAGIFQCSSQAASLSRNTSKTVKVWIPTCKEQPNPGFYGKLSATKTVNR